MQGDCVRPRVPALLLASVLAAAGMVVLATVSDAVPTIKTTCNGRGSGRVEVHYRFPPNVTPHDEYYPVAGNIQQPLCFEGVRFDTDNGDLDHITFSGCCVNGVMSQYLIDFGNVAAKGPGIESHQNGISDSVTVLISSTPTTVVLSLPTDGRLRLRAGATFAPQSKFILAVYPDSATAVLDPNLTGAGAAFVGSATLQSNGTLVTTGGFTNANFVVTNLGGGTYMAVPAAGVTKTAVVPSSVQADVVMLTDSTDFDVAPGYSPIGLALLSVLLVAGAGLTIRKRRAAVHVG